MRGTMREVLDNGEDGAQDSWKNPDSGASGTIKVFNTFEQNGLRCRRASFSNSAGGFEQTSTYNLCKVADGTWKFAP